MSPSERRESPLFVKTRDFILWLFRHTSRFPKQYRHTLTQRIELCALDFQHSLGRRSILKDSQALAKADLDLWNLRQLLRIAHDLGFFPARQLHYAAGQLVEIGKLLGAWRKQEGVKV
jgi:hypothetical protein